MRTAEPDSERVGMPIASDNAQAVEVASRLIRDVGYEPVLIGGLETGKHLMPGTALGGDLRVCPHSFQKINVIPSPDWD